MDLLEDCINCYRTTLSEFPQEIVVYGGLPAGDYIARVTDKFGNVFGIDAITVGGYGFLDIEIPDSFPVAWFSRNAGYFKLEVSLTAENWTPVNFTFEALEYPCILIDFSNNDLEINEIH